MATEVVIDLAYLGALQHQLKEYEELKINVRVNRIELKKVMLPASAYTETNTSVLESRCWYKYHASVVVVGQMETPEYSDETIEIVQDYFEGLATKEYKISFMLDIAHREQINIYIDRKLAEYGVARMFELMNTSIS